MADAQTPNRLTWSANDTGHRELDVMAMLETVLDSLLPDERRRVLAWANDRWAVAGSVTPTRDRNGE